MGTKVFIVLDTFGNVVRKSFNLDIVASVDGLSDNNAISSAKSASVMKRSG